MGPPEAGAVGAPEPVVGAAVGAPEPVVGAGVGVPEPVVAEGVVAEPAPDSEPEPQPEPQPELQPEPSPAPAFALPTTDAPAPAPVPDPTPAPPSSPPAAPAVVRPPLVLRDAPADPAATSSSTRRRATVVAAAAAVTALAVLVGVLVGRGGPGPDAAPAPLAVAPLDLAPFTRPDGLVVRRTWTLRDGGAALRGETVVTNETDAPVNAGVDEVVPKSVASDVGALTFAPEPAGTVRADPVVRYLARALPPGQTLQWRFDVVLPEPVTTAQGLADLAADADRERREYEASRPQPTRGPVRVVRLVVAPTALRLRPLETRSLVLSARLSDGRVLTGGAIPGIAVSSSDPRVVRNAGGVLRALAAGRVTVTARAGNARASAVVEVVAPPPPVVVPPVVVPPSVRPTPRPTPTPVRTTRPPSPRPVVTPAAPPPDDGRAPPDHRAAPGQHGPAAGQHCAAPGEHRPAPGQHRRAAPLAHPQPGARAVDAPPPADLLVPRAPGRPRTVAGAVLGCRGRLDPFLHLEPAWPARPPSPSRSPAQPVRSATPCCSASPRASCSAPTPRCGCACWRSSPPSRPPRARRWSWTTAPSRC